MAHKCLSEYKRKSLAGGLVGGFFNLDLKLIVTAMKPSKVEKILNYNPPLEDTKSTLPLSFYQPFQSGFESEFTIPPLQSTLLDNQWGGPATDRPPQLSTRSFRPLLSAPAPSSAPSPAPTASSSTIWGDLERRSLCNSTWRETTPRLQRPLVPTLEEFQGSSTTALPGLGAYSQFPQKNDTLFRAVRRPDSRTSFPIESCIRPMQKCDENRYYPLMLGSLGRNINHNTTKAVPAGHTRPMVCNFCKNNKEVPDIYLNHYLYDPETKVLSCPVLRKHVCEICGGTGDQAHTLQYCPVNRRRGLQAKVPVLLKARTVTDSTGKIRKN